MRIGLLQLNSSDDPEANLLATKRLVAEAVDGGADFILTPEVTNCVSASRSRQNAVLRVEKDDGTLSSLQELARAHGVSILIGSLALKVAGEARFANRSFLIGSQGEIVARYDKIHMFDVAISETETYHESAGYRPGTRASMGEIGQIKLGLTICYDLRFPHLFRDLAKAGAHIITVPSAFSPETGAAHWEVLLRARAIETGAFILAPAQCGTHAASEGRSRKTFGHSLVVDPWGKVIADGGDMSGVTLVDLDLSLVDDARARVPSLAHDRSYESP